LYPCDEEEEVRLDELHYVIRAAYGDNIIAPISRRPQVILDVGTGTGSISPKEYV
jgi:hypothetical protein